MARIGYARVSSVGQSLEMQLAKLADCDKIYREKRSGAVGNARNWMPAWSMCGKEIRW